MEKRIADKVGLTFPPYTYTIEPGKVKEFALAIGDPHPAYLDGSAVPPTFATVIEMWGGMDFDKLIQVLELNPDKVLHGEQEYVYLGKMRAGDQITVHSRVVKAYSKSAMNFIELESVFSRQDGEQVLISRSTVIERH